ncbi:hypothetical protein PAHAL_2G067500 [Panicum hallii]|uniref:Uncharacterized protein n=1 Tax=Panicum hallii TaxID=206008 RepID=A0A2T8KN42_9POAL|nr:hypothetical protein PAHAL_2G067500 [Panicum hallii]
MADGRGGFCSSSVAGQPTSASWWRDSPPWLRIDVVESPTWIRSSRRDTENMIVRCTRSQDTRMSGKDALKQQ